MAGDESLELGVADAVILGELARDRGMDMAL